MQSLSFVSYTVIFDSSNQENITQYKFKLFLVPQCGKEEVKSFKIL